MKAAEAGFLRFLRKSEQFVVPIYQRTYSWTDKECRQLWSDILRTGEKDDITSHFVGSIVYIEKGLNMIGDQTPYLVIDGQQRLTTVMLLLEALARHVGSEEPIEGFSAAKIRHYYLTNSLEQGDRRFKLILTQTDKQSLTALVQQKPQPSEPSVLITENFIFFQEQIRKLGKDVAILCMGLAKLVVVGIALDRNQDNPQLIFESMNSTGRDLTQADLIRNYVLMGLEPDQQEQLYEEHWRPMEVAFGQEGFANSFDWFMRHYLTFKREGVIPKIGAVYEAFKEHVAMLPKRNLNIEVLLGDIHKFADYYCAMAFDQELDPKLTQTFRNLNELNVGVAYPLLLELYDDHCRGLLSTQELVQAVSWIEAYVFRRAVCAIPTNSLNRTFALFGKALRKDDHYMRSFKDHLLSLQSYRRFPKDAEFAREFATRDLYNFRLRSYWLRRLENYNRKELVPMQSYTIEHILPQNRDLSEEWKTVLGPNWEEVQERWLHSLGNLTLTGYNPEYGDRSFAEKRDMQGGFKESPLWLNRGLGMQETWNEEKIGERAARLTEKAKVVWAIPSIPEEDQGG
jgi:uncharacterized protein with ParB-like and HNH nuclease domain